MECANATKLHRKCEEPGALLRLWQGLKPIIFSSIYGTTEVVP
jgi:hypothetical protein